jgi:hypothetical protein
MTYFLNFRTDDVGGSVTDPVLYESDGTAPATGWLLILPERIPALVAGKNILFATHGFNVNKADGANALGLLDQNLQLPSPNMFVGVLWPGDTIIPFINYPIEGGVAEDCGNRLANFCATSCASAQSLSFASHSLGARLMLQAVARLKGQRRASSLCLMAAAINQDCLTGEYANAAQNCDRISVLASRWDLVLKLAYPIGDPISNLLGADHNPFQPALGLQGPPTPAAAPIVAPWQISDAEFFDHLDYLPPTVPKHWPEAAGFMKRAFLGLPQTWPS